MEYEHEELVQYIKENCQLKKWQIAQSWECIGNHQPIPDEVSSKIDDVITDFCMDNDIDNDIVFENEETEELFMECF